MDDAPKPEAPGVTASRPGATAGTPAALDAFLAGLQSGMLGVLWMLAWMGLSATWTRRSFWAPENLLASVFHPRGEIAPDFTAVTFSGLALYLLIYSLLGAGFATLAARQPMRRARTVLLALVAALAWYYFSFHLLWKTISPAVAFLNPERAAVVGHLIYGLVLGRFHRYLPPAEPQATEIALEHETKTTAP
jgi:hypothetical protein